jgi:hypothetical protein
MDKPGSNLGSSGGLSAPSQGTQPLYAGTAGTPGQPYSQYGGLGPQSGGVSTPDVKDVGRQAKAAAGDVVQQASELAHSTAESRKGEIADRIHSVAGALRGAKSSLSQQGDSTLPQYVDKAADRIEQFSDYLRERDVRDMIGDVQRTARREPALFLGGAFLLGFIGMRFLKASGDFRIARGGDGHDEAFKSSAYAPVGPDVRLR